MIVHKSKQNILIWNARSISNKLIELYSYLEDNFIDICCISETHLKPNIRLHSHPDYLIHRFDRIETTMGGVLIIIRRELKHELLPIVPTNLIENISIEVALNQRKIIFYYCYLPGGLRSDVINQHYADDLDKITRTHRSFFALGDFNSKHRSWNCPNNNRAGNILSDYTNNGQCFVLHSDSQTHFPSNSNNQPSTIDLNLDKWSLLNQRSSNRSPWFRPRRRSI